MGGADGGATQAAWLAGTAWWLGRPGWRLTRHPRAAQLESARPWPAPPHASQPPGPELDRVLDLAEAAGPSRLPLRP